MVNFNLFGQEINNSGLILAYGLTSSSGTSFERLGSILASTEDAENIFKNGKNYGFIEINQKHIKVKKNNSGFYEINRETWEKAEHWYGIGIRNCRRPNENWTELDFLNFASDLVERINLPVLGWKSSQALDKGFRKVMDEFQDKLKQTA